MKTLSNWISGCALTAILLCIYTATAHVDAAADAHYQTSIRAQVGK